jgi:hypothetical protein
MSGYGSSPSWMETSHQACCRFDRSERQRRPAVRSGRGHPTIDIPTLRRQGGDLARRRGTAIRRIRPAHERYRATFPQPVHSSTPPLRGILRFADKEPGHYRVLFSAASLGPVHIGVTNRPHPGAPSFYTLVESVQRCMNAGARPGGDATFVAIMLWSTLHGFADLRIGKPEMAWPPAAKVVKDLLRRLHLDRKAPLH